MGKNNKEQLSNGYVSIVRFPKDLESEIDFGERNKVVFKNFENARKFADSVLMKMVNNGFEYDKTLKEFDWSNGLCRYIKYVVTKNKNDRFKFSKEITVEVLPLAERELKIDDVSNNESFGTFEADWGLMEHKFLCSKEMSGPRYWLTNYTVYDKKSMKVIHSNCVVRNNDEGNLAIFDFEHFEVAMDCEWHDSLVHVAEMTYYNRQSDQKTPFLSTVQHTDEFVIQITLMLVDKDTVELMMAVTGEETTEKEG